ncbi:MAG: hypothetical protein V2A73_13165, partial [Pseudomonadota bacterium]
QILGSRAMPRSHDTLMKLFEQKTVVDLSTIREALGGVTAMTAFRHLRRVPYRRSYNHNGGYYCLYDPSRCDRMGLWNIGDIHFSKDGSLKATVRRMVCESEVGATHRELADWLRIRVHNTLLSLVHDQEVSREQVEAIYVYLHPEAMVRTEQLARRRELVERRRLAAAGPGEDLDDAVVIQVLLALVRHPGSGPAQVVRLLHGHAPPITAQQVHAVFTRYDLGEKGGPRIS